MESWQFTADPHKILDAFDFGDKTFKCSQITAADLLHLQAALDREHPGARIHVAQPCYNVGVDLSAGTHDKDAVLDFIIVGLTWLEAQAFLRRHGWTAWWRHTGDWADPALWHLHAISLAAFKAGCPVGDFIPGQVDDYYRHALGLVDGHDTGSDPTWHPADIDSTVFDYRHWFKQQEDAMPFRDWPQADQDALTGAVADKVTAALLGSVVGPATDAVTVKQSLYRASNVPDLARAILAKLSSKR
jgi:hypothetical protein